MKNFLRWTATLSLGLAFAGCGGGNGGIVTPTPTPTATLPPTLYSTPVKLPDISQLNGLNNQNQILAVNPSGIASVFLNSPTSTPQNLKFYEGSYIVALDINNNGNMIGEAFTSPSPAGTILPPMYWSTPSATPQPLNAPQGVVKVNDINDSGGIVGWGTKNQQQVALYWNSPTAESTVLATATGEQSPAAVAISSNNAIVGTYGPGTTPLYWASPISTSQTMTRLPAQTGIIKWMGINNKGNVFLVDGNSVSAFYSSPMATPIRLSFLPGAASSSALLGALSMNASGVVVGTSPNSSGNLRAVRWVNGVVQDLNTLLPANSGWVLQRASHINDSGTIVGTGTLNGSAASFYMSLQ